MRKSKRPARKIVLYGILCLLTLFFLFPFYMLISRSLMPLDEAIDTFNVTFFPKHVTLDAFKTALDASFLLQLKNTLIVLAVTVIGVPLIAYMSAYAFARVNFVGKNFWFAIALATIMIPSIVLQVPMFKMFSDFGWTSTLYPLTIPVLCGGGVMNIFLMRQYLLTIPRDFEGSAMIDGANRLQCMFRIILPQAKPVYMLVAVNTFLAVWNDFNSPLIYITDEAKYTLPLGIYVRFSFATTSFDAMPNVQMALGLLMMIPPAILFCFFQKELIEGVSLGGIKE